MELFVAIITQPAANLFQKYSKKKLKIFLRNLELKYKNKLFIRSFNQTYLITLQTVNQNLPPISSPPPLHLILRPLPTISLKNLKF